MSLWDKLDRFSAADAAALAVPNDASEGRALLIRMQKGYEKALSETVFKHQDTAHPGVRGHGSALRYGSFDVPLPEEHLYSWALELHAKLLFRPDFHVVSCQAFHNWVREEAGSHGAFSCNFGAQEFSRDELYRWLTFHGIESAYAFKRLAPTTPVVPVAPKPLDITVLATPEDLLKAFGQWGLKKDWFNSPRKHGWLSEARKRIGVGGNQSKPPLYCPYEVMVGLATKTKPRYGHRPMSERKGWQILRQRFSAAYSKFGHLDYGDQSY